MDQSFWEEGIMNIEEKIAFSADLLDLYASRFSWIGSDWREKIDLDKLNMNSTENCILGQLHTGNYNDAHEEFRSSGIDIEGGRYIFGAATSSWLKYLKESLSVSDDFKDGTVWYSDDASSARTIQRAFTVDGEDWVAYSWTSTTGIVPAGVRCTLKSQFVSGYSVRKPKRFKKGYKLISDDGNVFYYFTDDKVILVHGGHLSWASLAYYEKQHGTMKRSDFSSSEFYFSGEHFWND
jgi:hypothetical protein